MPISPSSSSPRWAALLGLTGVLLLFALPLFVGLRGWDMRNDEAIYSYAVDRILETGEWLTPRSIPTDGPFLEKPPLKFWMVAGAMKAGLLPHDDFGQRFLDALMGAIAFIYVYAIGRRASGPICGFVAVLVLFTLDPVIFEHGLRSNNMEAALFLSYCGGMFHFLRWAEATAAGPRRLHAIAVGAYFVLGFLTKFVAALFLPPALLVALLLRRDAWTRIKTTWHDWLAPVVLVIAAAAPWFVYEHRTYGDFFWNIILGEHVYTRFTGALDPTHLHPWHYYFTQTWRELKYGHSTALGIAGVLMLAWQATRGGSWLARLLLVWWLLPLTLMSLGTSKLFHYAYPFLPPIALGAGWAAAAFLRAANGSWGVAATDWLGRFAPASGDGASPRARLAQRLFVIGGLLAIAMGLWTAVFGQVAWTVGGTRLFQNSSIYRPLVIGALMLRLGGQAKMGIGALAVLALSVVLPLRTYVEKAQRTTSIDHPLRSLKECGLSLQAGGGSGPVAKGVYNVATEGMHHSYFFYLRHLGPYVDAPNAPPEELRKRLFTPGEQVPVLMSLSTYNVWQVTPDAQLPDAPARMAADNWIVVLLPGPYRSCAAAMTVGGGKVVADPDKTKDTARADTAATTDAGRGRQIAAHMSLPPADEAGIHP